jgi:hypothetical protein
MTQTIHELNEGWSVETPLGYGVALLVTTPSYLSNSILYVKMEDGRLLHMDSNDVRLLGSPTYGEDLIPNLPEGWKNHKPKDTVK